MSPAKLGTSEAKPWVLEGSSMFSTFLGGNGADIMGKPSNMILLESVRIRETSGSLPCHVQ